jgi:hypothetical protein
MYNSGSHEHQTFWYLPNFQAKSKHSAANIKDFVQEYNICIFYAMFVKSCHTIIIIIIKINILHEKHNFSTNATYNLFYALKRCFQSLWTTRLSSAADSHFILCPM